ncbi:MULTISPECIES: dihydroxyacetone kinase family protein [unclassified Microbacterium]|uniref:dihydroxyacetone kinase family protein n=1 Tax=unclassified Microbacterium TaxID=2609290 RepID=UPI00097EF63C|nr:dihydroxyacetone kinase family protein [Microbacterium sp. JB110]RCS56916.1 dihydroxyacetone kinase family protein [Microbacterium sp. JB110]SJM44619.1 Dihydroxyacetone kinase, ATP-dependent [Frigoribacterium sp. JB110]
MSYVVNEAENFADESAAGFVAAHRDLVRRVPGGVARATSTPQGQVAVVIGGGSGHYPAFAGLVGPGLAHGAAMGNVFASPSAQQVRSVAAAVEAGGGVLLSYGNYAGDVLNFDAAQQQLRDAGVPCRTVRVTDDVVSASVSEREKRRGIAGDLAVFRAAGWAAERGMELDEVVEFADRANERTRSFGVAFSGCTLPGADSPLFTVPEGKMAVGMGIHGEPGIEVRDLPTADELADLLVAKLLDERPDDVPSASGARVAIILNGLGSVKHEELFVVFGAVARLLEERGITIVQPEVGEYATSFEMAGMSLTLLWLDDELEQAWASPALTPAYRKGTLDLGDAVLADAASDEAVAAIAVGSAESIAAAACVRGVLGAMRDLIDREADALGRLDAIAGDGDHGIGMKRGVHAACDEAERADGAGAGAGTVLTLAGDAWADRAGGTSGALWGAGLRSAGEVLGDTNAPDAATVAAAVTAACETVQRQGKAELGDKTMVDALVPFAQKLASRVGAGAALQSAWREAAEAAQAAARATAELLPRMGRARPHAEASVGTPDPGAVSFAQAMVAATDVIGGAALD